jgi:SAM-dependent methyltransferase
LFEATGITAVREAEYYDLFTEWREDIGFFVTVAKQYGGPVLEVGCGTGRVTRHIAAAGIGIDGLDSSPERLRIAGEGLPAESGVKLFCQDMRAFRLPVPYRLAMLPYRVLQELATTAEKIQCLSCVRDHLEEGGLVLIDNYNPSIPMLARDPATSARVMEKPGPGGEIIQRTDRVVSRDYLSQTQQLEVIYDVRHADGRTEHYVIPYETSYMFRFELEHLLARCGFTVREIWGGFDFEPFGQGASDELIVLAERAAAALQPAAEAALVVFSLPRRAPWATLAGPLSGTPRDLPCRRERRTTLAEGRHFREDRQQPSPRYQGPAPRQRRGQGPCAGVDHGGVPAIRIPAHRNAGSRGHRPAAGRPGRGEREAHLPGAPPRTPR